MVGLVSLLLWLEQPATREDFWELTENAIITLLGEYPDHPKTAAGQVLQLVLFILGTLFFGAIIGRFSSYFVVRSLRKGDIVKAFKDHVVICNWNLKAPAILSQILEASKQNPFDIVVISASEVKSQTDFKDLENVHIVQGDPTHHATLARFGASQAKSVILLADEESQGPDDKNALIALAIKHLEHTPGHERDIHVISELVRPERRRHLEDAGVDELISSREYSSGIIAQSALFKRMSVVYQELLNYSDTSNEFYFVDAQAYPQELVGMTFEELSQWLAGYSTVYPESPVLLVGVKRGDGEILLNPKRSHFARLRSDDALIVMAFQPVNLLRTTGSG